jgi:hypothetical protein
MKHSKNWSSAWALNSHSSYERCRSLSAAEELEMSDQSREVCLSQYQYSLEEWIFTTRDREFRKLVINELLFIKVTNCVVNVYHRKENVRSNSENTNSYMSSRSGSFRSYSNLVDIRMGGKVHPALEMNI